MRRISMAILGCVIVLLHCFSCLSRHSTGNVAEAEDQNQYPRPSRRPSRSPTTSSTRRRRIRSSPPSIPPDPAILRFLLLGDWGKGGKTAKYMSSIEDSFDYFDESQEAADIISASTNGTPSTHNTQSLSIADQILNDETNDWALQSNDKNRKNNDKNGGKTQSLHQVQIAKAMSDFASNFTPTPQFVLALGDNFYTNGVKNATDKLWDYLWKDVYLQYPALNIPWYAVLGNHDYGGGDMNSWAQVERSKAHLDDDLWNMPAKNYSKIFSIPNSRGGSVAVLFVDTTTLAPSINKCCNQNGGISSEVQAARIANQLQHLERMLVEMIAEEPTWLLAIGHYPIYSAGSSGDVSELINYLLPLLQQYKVHAFICGHDHISEHLRLDGIEYFVAGAGSMTDTLSKTPSADLIWAGAGYGAFAYMDASPSDLTIGYLDTNGTLRYQYTLTNPLRPQQDGPKFPIGDKDPGDIDPEYYYGSDLKPGDNDVDNSKDIDALNQELSHVRQESQRMFAVAIVTSSLAVAGIVITGLYFFVLGPISVIHENKKKTQRNDYRDDKGDTRMTLQTTKESELIGEKAEQYTPYILSSSDDDDDYSSSSAFRSHRNLRKPNQGDGNDNICYRADSDGYHYRTAHSVADEDIEHGLPASIDNIPTAVMKEMPLGGINSNDKASRVYSSRSSSLSSGSMESARGVTVLRGADVAGKIKHHRHGYTNLSLMLLTDLSVRPNDSTALPPELQQSHQPETTANMIREHPECIEATPEASLKCYEYFSPISVMAASSSGKDLHEETIMNEPLPSPLLPSAVSSACLPPQSAQFYSPIQNAKAHRRVYTAI